MSKSARPFNDQKSLPPKILFVCQYNQVPFVIFIVAAVL